MSINLKICILLILNLTSCSTQKQSKFEYNFGEKEAWINCYKTEVFWGCFKESYKNDTLVKIITKKDFLNQPEIIGNWDVFLEAFEKGINISQKIPQPIYPKFEEGDREEFYKKNYFLASCLNYYKSKELDIIAKKEYKKHIQSEKESQRVLNSK